jgi:hypothetical protein
MTLSGVVRSATAGLIGFDYSSSALNTATAKQFADQGYKFCVRYVSRDDALRGQHSSDGTPDLSQSEGQAILNAGMALMVVQHPPLPGWAPTADLGKTYGANAADYAAAAGLPENVCVWLDLEGVASGTSETTW